MEVFKKLYKHSPDDADGFVNACVPIDVVMDYSVGAQDYGDLGTLKAGNKWS